MVRPSPQGTRKGVARWAAPPRLSSSELTRERGKGKLSLYEASTDDEGFLMVDADKEMSGPGSSAERPGGQRDGHDSDKPVGMMTATELLKTADTTRTMTEGVKEAEWGGTGPDGKKGAEVWIRTPHIGRFLGRHGGGCRPLRIERPDGCGRRRGHKR